MEYLLIHLFMDGHIPEIAVDGEEAQRDGGKV
jgi:hypothetical protein